MSSASCKHSPTGYADITVPGKFGPATVTALKLCDICLKGTPLNPRARKVFRQLPKPARKQVGDLLRRKHAGYEVA